MALLVYVLAEAARASCGWQCQVVYNPGTSSEPAPLATVEHVNVNDEVVGPDTPPPDAVLQGANPDVDLPAPWDEFSSVLARLWDEQQEVTVFMIASYLRRLRTTCPRRLRPGLATALDIVLPYDDGAVRTFIPPWWRTWVDGLLQRSLQVRPGNGDTEEDIVTLMQQKPGPWRPELWKNLLLQLREYPEGIQGVVARRLRRWIRGQLDAQTPPLIAFGSMLNDIEKVKALHTTATQ